MHRNQQSLKNQVVFSHRTGSEVVRYRRLCRAICGGDFGGGDDGPTKLLRAEYAGPHLHPAAYDREPMRQNRV